MKKAIKRFSALMGVIFILLSCSLPAFAYIFRTKEQDHYYFSEGKPFTDKWEEDRLRTENEHIQKYKFPINTDKFYYFGENLGCHIEKFPNVRNLVIHTQVDQSKCKGSTIADMITYTDPSKERPEKALTVQKVAIPIQFNPGKMSDREEIYFGPYGLNLVNSDEDGPHSEDNLQTLFRKSGYYQSEEAFSSMRDTEIAGYRAVEMVEYRDLYYAKKSVPSRYNFHIDVSPLFRYGNKKGRHGPVIIFSVDFRCNYFDADDYQTEDLDAASHFMQTIEEFKKNFALELHKPILISSLDYWLDGTGLAPDNLSVEKSDSSVDKKAEVQKGEDKGVNIPLAVMGTVAGIGSVAAAGFAAAGAAAGGNSSGGDSPDGESERESYRMYLSKDFGNRIKKGGQGREIRARIEKTTSDGDIIRRDDLSYNISFNGGTYLHTGEKYGVGGSAAVEIWADENVPKEIKEDFISVIYSGEGGTFTERIHFDLVGDTYITFPEMDSHGLMMNIDVIGGDKAEYNVMFRFEDAEEEPEKISFSSENQNFEITHELIENYTYDAIIKNHTSPIETKVYELEERSFVEITAVFKDGTEVKNGFNISIYPEGLSVRAKSQDGIVQIKSVESKNRGEMDYPIPPVQLKPVIAVLRDFDDGIKRAVIAELSDTKIVFDKLKAEKELSVALLEKYDYEVKTDRISSGYCDFIPKKQIPSYYPPDDWEKRQPEDYEVFLPLSVQYENEEFRMDIPCLLIGSKLDPMGVWKEEYRRVVDSILAYVPDFKQDEKFAELSRMLKSRSVKELRIMEKKIRIEAQKYYTDRAADYMTIDKYLGWCQTATEFVQTINDIAFSIVVTKLTSPVGEAIITPLKDILMSALGEVSLQIYQGEPFNPEKIAVFDNIAKIGENLVCSELDLSTGMTPAQYKKALTVLTGYMAYSIITKYLATVNSGKPDLFGTITSTISDLTQNVIKSFSMGTLKNYLSSPEFQKKLSEFFSKHLSTKFICSEFNRGLKKKGYGLKPIMDKDPLFKDTMLDDILDENGRVIPQKLYMWENTFEFRDFITQTVNNDILQKYVEEFFGKGIAFVQKSGEDIAGSILKNNEDLYRSKGDKHVRITFGFFSIYSITVDFTALFEKSDGCLTAALEALYETVWGFLPFDTEKTEVPEDPPVKMDS